MSFSIQHIKNTISRLEFDFFLMEGDENIENEVDEDELERNRGMWAQQLAVASLHGVYFGLISKFMLVSMSNMCCRKLLAI